LPRAAGQATDRTSEAVKAQVDVVHLDRAPLAVPGEEDLRVDYEIAVLAPDPELCGSGSSASTGPFEVPVIELPDGDPLAAYVVDPVAVARSADHGRGIARTEVIQVGRVGA
jgi:hypothetical protein